jgi:pimeloyl-ACP methyl ester carboxylesterase
VTCSNVQVGKQCAWKGRNTLCILTLLAEASKQLRETMGELYLFVVSAVLVTAVLALLVYVAAKALERRNPPIGKFLEIDGTRLHYFERGDGPPVVFLHGNATMLQDFLLSEAFASTAKHNRAIAIDRPGFGYSTRPRARSWTACEQADVLAGALRRLNVGAATIVGHSWGTLVAVALAERHPALVRSLVLLSGYFYPTPRFDAVLASVGSLPVAGDILRYTLTPLVGLFMLPVTLRAMFAPCPVSERFGREFPRLMMLRPWQLRASLGDGALMLPSAASLQLGYSSLQVPTFIAAGGDDRIVDQWHSSKFHQEVHASQFQILPGIGHMLQHSAPADVTAIIGRASRWVTHPH